MVFLACENFIWDEFDEEQEEQVEQYAIIGKEYQFLYQLIIEPVCDLYKEKEEKNDKTYDFERKI